MITLPDTLIEQAHTVFDTEYRRLWPGGGDEADHDEAVRSALAAVAELVRADQTRQIVEWMREEAFAAFCTDHHEAGERWRRFADAIERQFGTQPEERKPCPTCKGKGRVVKTTDGGGATDGEFSYEVWCPDCTQPEERAA